MREESSSDQYAGTVAARWFSENLGGDTLVAPKSERSTRKKTERRSTRSQPGQVEKDTVINFRTSSRLRDEIDAAAKAAGLTRTALIEMGIDLALKQLARQGRKGDGDA